MKEAMTLAQKRVRQIDALRWVAQESRALSLSGVLSGVRLPRSSRFREALAALEAANDITTVDSAGEGCNYGDTCQHAHEED